MSVCPFCKKEFSVFEDYTKCPYCHTDLSSYMFKNFLVKIRDVHASKPKPYKPYYGQGILSDDILPTYKPYHGQRILSDDILPTYKSYYGPGVLPVTKPDPKPMAISSVIGCEKTGTTNEFMYVYEKGVIDNSKSSAKVEKTISVSQKWSRTCVIEKEKSETQGLKISIGNLLVNLEGEARKTIREYFHMKEETESVETQAVTVIAPDGKKIQYTINVMRKLYLGNLKCMVKFDDNTTKETKVPFKQTYGLLFGVETIDLKSERRKSK